MNPEKISIEKGKLIVPNNPIIPFIEGDGTGRDIWKASVRVIDAAVKIAYDGKRQIAWKEVLQDKKLLTKQATGCPMKPLQHLKNI
jgi:isocitrate dehydrogenase